MPDQTIDQKLREMAEHRGFKLVKSRRRKPGTGDFGKFGLTQADGKPMLGVGEKGLTASADDIEAYLRKGAVSTWKASAESLPVRVALAEKPKGNDEAENDTEDVPVIRSRGTHVVSRNAGARPAKPVRRKAESSDEPKSRGKRAGRTSTGHQSAPPVAAPVIAEPPQAPVPATQLHVRTAKPGDATALAKLLTQLTHVDIDELGIARNLEAARKFKGGMAVAELGTLVGCCACAIVPTIQHGLIGRITLILVDKDHRRRGIATAMFEDASAALAKAGCTRVEAMSEIGIRNDHGFFRTLKFEQTSYRFAKALDRKG